MSALDLQVRGIVIDVRTVSTSLVATHYLKTFKGVMGLILNAGCAYQGTVEGPHCYPGGCPHDDGHGRWQVRVSDTR